MSEVITMPGFGKKFAENLAESMGKDKYERVAHETLRDLMLFNNALESELHSMMAAMHKGLSIDHELMEKMTTVKNKYNYAMSGLAAFDEEMQRFALTSLADAIQDLMFYLHRKKRH